MGGFHLQASVVRRFGPFSPYANASQTAATCACTAGAARSGAATSHGHCNTRFIWIDDDGSVTHDVACELEAGHDGLTHERTLESGIPLPWRAHPDTITTRHAPGQITVEPMPGFVEIDE